MTENQREDKIYNVFFKLELTGYEETQEKRSFLKCDQAKAFQCLE
jgi:hypothetical protein